MLLWYDEQSEGVCCCGTTYRLKECVVSTTYSLKECVVVVRRTL